ncbi:MAG: cell division protein FtsQ/DivIB [Rubrobacteraceae bacterium]
MSIRPGIVLRSISFSVAAAAFTAAAIFIVSYLLDPVTGVKVEGARMLPESEVWETVSDRASLLTLNPEMLKRKVESNPWVEGVKVTKDWRSGIVLVKVEERQAVLNGDLNGRRVILATDGTELPGLGGVDLGRVEVDEDQVREILEAGRTLESHGIALDSIDEVSASGVTATVEGRKVIFADHLSDEQAGALPGIMKKNPKAPLFDLRSPGRVVIGASADHRPDSETSG